MRSAVSSHAAVVDEVEISPANVGNAVPATLFERALGVVRARRLDGTEIDVPTKVRETQYAALAATGLALLHCVVSTMGGVDCVLGSIGHFFAAWATGGVALLFALRSRWVWAGALGLTSLQACHSIFALVTDDMPAGVGPFTVLLAIMASVSVLGLLLRRDVYTWFAPAE